MTREEQNIAVTDRVLRKMYQQSSTNEIGTIDKTFAARLYLFLQKVEVNDLAGEEEKEYLMGVARKLIAYQKATAQTFTESEYFRRLGL